MVLWCNNIDDDIIIKLNVVWYARENVEKVSLSNGIILAFYFKNSKKIKNDFLIIYLLSYLKSLKIEQNDNLNIIKSTLKYLMIFRFTWNINHKCRIFILPISVISFISHNLESNFFKLNVTSLFQKKHDSMNYDWDSFIKLYKSFWLFL